MGRNGQLLTQIAAARVLGVHPETLRRWALKHHGPPTLRIGKRRYYAREIITQWLKAQSAAS